MKRLGIILLATLVVAGCKHAPSVVGAWNVTVSSIPTVVEFSSNNTATVTGQSTGVDFTVDGTYDYEDPKLTVIGKSVKLTNVPSALKGMAQKSAEGLFLRTRDCEVTWDGNDSFTAKTADGETFEFHRKKA